MRKPSQRVIGEHTPWHKKKIAIGLNLDIDLDLNLKLESGVIN